MTVVPKQARGKGDQGSVYAVYRTCSNVEAGEILFEHPLLWFDTRSAAQASFDQSAHQASECVRRETDIIRCNQSLVFSSAYSWTTILFEFASKGGESLRLAEQRIQASIRGEDFEAARSLLLSAVVVSGGESLEPSGVRNETQTLRDVDLVKELEQVYEVFA